VIKWYSFLCTGMNIVANRPTPETDLNADFTYVDGYDSSPMSQPLNVRTSQPKLFSFFRSKKTAEPSDVPVQPIQTTITAGVYNSPRSAPQQQSSARRRDNNPPWGDSVPAYQQNVPQLLVTAPSRPDTADFTDADWSRGDDRWSQNPGQPSWQTMNAVEHHPQPRYGRDGGAAFVTNGSQGWAQPGTEFDAFQSAGFSNSPPYAGSNGWSTAMPREGSPRRSPRLGEPQRSFDDHWATEGDRTAPAENAGWERRRSMPSIVKLPAPATPKTQTKQRANNNVGNAAPLRQQPVETYVIENGVRKRVRYEGTIKNLHHQNKEKR